MQLLGGNIATDAQGIPKIEELTEVNNVALVLVTAEIPQAGAQQGDTLDCTISALSAKSIEGGTLMLTPLVGPRADRPTVYALAQGPITISNRLCQRLERSIKAARWKLPFVTTLFRTIRSR